MSKTDEELRRNILNVRHKSCNDWLILRECQDCEIEVDAIMELIAADRSQLLERVLGELTSEIPSFEGNTPGKVWLDADACIDAIRRMQGEGKV